MPVSRPKPAPLEQNTYHHGVLLVGVVILFLALYKAFSPGLPPILNDAQVFNFYANYSHGYIHRGLLGSILALVVGDFDRAWANQVMSFVQRGLAVFCMVLLWGLLFGKIVRSRHYSSLARWWLTAFAAVLFFAPIWTLEMQWLGFMDVYIYACLLLAAAAFIGHRPVVFVILMLLAQVFHRGGFVMSLVLCLMAAYAAFYSPAYFRYRKKWLTAAAMPLILYLLLITVDNPAGTTEALRQSEFINDPSAARYLDYAGAQSQIGIREVLKKIGWYSVYMEIFIWSMAIFAMPAILLSLLFFWFRKQNNLGFWHIKSPPPPPIFRGKFCQWMEFLIPVGAVMITLPLLIVFADVARCMYWTWFNLSLVVVCQLYAFSPDPDDMPKRKKKNRPPPVSIWLTMAGLTVAAVMYAGTHTINSHIPQTSVFQCRQNCLPLLHNNVLSRWLSNLSFEKLNITDFPFVIDPSQRLNRYHFLPNDKDVRLRNNHLLVPSQMAEKDDSVFGYNVLVSRPNLLFDVYYQMDNFDGTAPFEFISTGKIIPPEQVSAKHARWRTTFDHVNIAYGNIRSTHPQSFELLSVVFNSY